MEDSTFAINDFCICFNSKCMVPLNQCNVTNGYNYNQAEKFQVLINFFHWIKRLQHEVYFLGSKPAIIQWGYCQVIFRSTMQTEILQINCN